MCCAALKPLRRRAKQMREFSSCCRDLDRAMRETDSGETVEDSMPLHASAFHARLPRFDPEKLLVFQSPREFFVCQAAMLASALVCFQSQLLAGRQLSRRQHVLFQWLLQQSYHFMDSFLKKTTEDPGLLAGIQDCVVQGQAQSRRIYDPVRIDKIEKEQGFGPLMHLVQGGMTERETASTSR